MLFLPVAWFLCFLLLDVACCVQRGQQNGEVYRRLGMKWECVPTVTGTDGWQMEREGNYTSLDGLGVS